MGSVIAKLINVHMQRAKYFASIIIIGWIVFSIASRLPSSISGLIRLFERPIKARGIQTTEKTVPKSWIFSWLFIKVILKVQNIKNIMIYFVRL